MGLWMVRAGKHGEQEQAALEHGLIAIGWNDLPDLSTFKSKEDLARVYGEFFPDEKPKAAIIAVSQLWRFVHGIQKGDMVVLPLKSESSIQIGRITGSYAFKEFAENVKHIRSVEWIKKLPRATFPKDLLYSFGAACTVCQIQSNEAEARVRAILDGKVPSPPPEPDEIQPIDVLRLAECAYDRLLNSNLKTKAKSPVSYFSVFTGSPFGSYWTVIGGFFFSFSPWGPS